MSTIKNPAIPPAYHLLSVTVEDDEEHPALVTFNIPLAMTFNGDRQVTLTNPFSNRGIDIPDTSVVLDVTYSIAFGIVNQIYSHTFANRVWFEQETPGTAVLLSRGIALTRSYSHLDNMPTLPRHWHYYQFTA